MTRLTVDIRVRRKSWSVSEAVIDVDDTADQHHQLCQ